MNIGEFIAILFSICAIGTLIGFDLVDIKSKLEKIEKQINNSDEEVEE